MDPKTLPVVLVGALVLFSMYRRFRRQFGQQPIQPARLTVRTLLLAGVAALLLVSSALSPGALATGVAGLLAGVALAVVGLRLTKFEWRGEHGFYTPNTHIGVVLSALLVSRLLYRFLRLSPAAASPGQFDSGNSLAAYNNPLTRAMALAIIGYYLVYFAGVLLLDRRRARAAGRAPPS